MTAKGWGVLEVRGGGIEKKGKGLMDTDNSVVIAGGPGEVGYKWTKWYWKKYN